ncbi:hypothetical protein K5X82_17170 [Halosquirtibacter xylanolyticus]|uniref:hypothetical protein n=1 Tax=Halosquirtibacter xylanolyticus TaxID=3374599 RepID=UPI003749AC1C|nr:hypothetical protein K5X82_17170 [Prolixibacteraceae bacterium]
MMDQFDGRYNVGILGEVMYYLQRGCCDFLGDCSSLTNMGNKVREELCEALIYCFQKLFQVSYRAEVLEDSSYNFFREVMMKRTYHEVLPLDYVDLSKLSMSSIPFSVILSGEVRYYDGKHLNLYLEVSSQFISEGYILVLRYSSKGGDCSWMQDIQCFDGDDGVCGRLFDVVWDMPMDDGEVHFWVMIYDSVNDSFWGSRYFSFYMAPKSS